jgi:hypothetical protein
MTQFHVFSGFIGHTGHSKTRSVEVPPNRIACGSAELRRDVDSLVRTDTKARLGHVARGAGQMYINVQPGNRDGNSAERHFHFGDCPRYRQWLTFSNLTKKPCSILR